MLSSYVYVTLHYQPYTANPTLPTLHYQPYTTNPTLPTLHYQTYTTLQVDSIVARFTKGAAQGHMKAQAFLADLYNMKLVDGVSWKEADAKAVELHTQAAYQGHGRSQYMLGEYYSEGKGGLEQSPELAVMWWRWAATGGGVEMGGHGSAATMSRANFALGDAYMDGRGVEQSYAEAQRLYKLAIAQEKRVVQLEGGWRWWGLGATGEGEAERRRKIDDNIKRYCPLLGKRVVLHGMSALGTSHPDMLKGQVNLRGGTAIDFGKNAYTIVLDDCYGGELLVYDGDMKIRANRLNVLAMEPTFWVGR